MTYLNQTIYKVVMLPVLFPLFLKAQNYQPTSNGEVVTHTYYSLSYIEKHEQAEWVYYKLTSSMVNGSVTRTDNFRPDPNVSTISSQLSDYKNSGYDRGHLAAAGDMKISRLAMSESFYMSNISPQNPSFNRGGWRTMEATVRHWAAQYGTIYVVTGGVLTSQSLTTGSNRVTVPSYYYKIVYVPSRQKMIAVVMPNQRITQPLSSYVVSTDYVESITEIDFFPQLSDVIEEKLEASASLDGFVFKQFKNNSTSPKTGTANQCKGAASTTGQSCKNRTTNTNGYCYAHQKQSPDYKAPSKSSYVGRCSATTQKGTRCKRNASSGSRFCWQHQ